MAMIYQTNAIERVKEVCFGCFYGKEGFYSRYMVDMTVAWLRVCNCRFGSHQHRALVKGPKMPLLLVRI